MELDGRSGTTKALSRLIKSTNDSSRDTGQQHKICGYKRKLSTRTCPTTSCVELSVSDDAPLTRGSGENNKLSSKKRRIEIPEEKGQNISEAGPSNISRNNKTRQMGAVVPEKSVECGRVGMTAETSTRRTSSVINRPRVSVYHGTVVRCGEGFGEIKPDQKFSDQFLHFKPTLACSGRLGLQPGDKVSFSIDKTKINAKNVRLLKCDRNPQIIEKYLDTLLLRMKSDSDEPISLELSCLPVWHCIGQCRSMLLVCLLKLLRVLIELASFEHLRNNVLSVYEVLLECSVFDSNGGTLKGFIKSVDGNELSVIQQFIYMAMKLLPTQAKRLTNLIAPMASKEFHPSNEFFYKLLKLSVKRTCPIESLDWNELPLVPSVEEFTSSVDDFKNNLTRVQTDRPYESAEVYLDTYFRLLRADCVSSLTTGIANWLKGQLNDKDMAVYNGIEFEGVYLTQHSTGLTVALRLHPPAGRKWNNKSLLMFGNLVCLSISGTFQDPIWATVANRDLLQDHNIALLELCLECDNQSSGEVVSALKFLGPMSVLVESPTFYRAYQPVLKSLQRMTSEALPFQEELVYSDCHKQPGYISEKTKFDLKVLYDKVEIEIAADEDFIECMEDVAISPGVNGVDSIKSRTDQNISLPINAITYCKLDAELGETTLDTSQVNAVKQCLKNRVAIIQGPPGTGKTFIGVKVLQMLLSLTPKLDSPILILTYRNHSLDEFLKEVVKLFPDSVARVGGRSQEALLTNCCLNELQKRHRMPEHLYMIIKEFEGDLDGAKQSINSYIQRLCHLQRFTVDVLLDYLTDQSLTDFLLHRKWKIWEIDSVARYTTEDIKTLTDKCQGKVRELCIQARSNEQDSLGKELLRTLEIALDDWLPSISAFKRFEEALMKNYPVKNLIGESKQHQTLIGNENDLSEELLEERLKTVPLSTSNKEEILANMFRIRQEQVHILKHAKDFISIWSPLLQNGIKYMWLLPHEDRIKLVQCILYKKVEDTEKELGAALSAYEKLVRNKEEIKDLYKARILREKKVVGMTVTGVNIQRSLIAQMKPEVVIVEEAAEVLEPQILAALGTWTKQLILIGDHAQLRPKVETHALSKEYQLDVSMMERLINNNFPCATLTKQNRMRPEFAELLLDIYPHLESNDAVVERHEKASCIKQSMYFWSHCDYETVQQSYTNKPEAERAVYLAFFLIDQGYNSSQITLLSPYRGQVKLMRKMVNDEQFWHHHSFDKNYPEPLVVNAPGTCNKSIKVYTVDMYQGDENDFVIISLVRSNTNGDIGFLKVTNRRCVAQSRARRGLYFIGNTYTLSMHPTWKRLISKMNSRSLCGTNLTLQCPRHNDCQILATTAADIPLCTAFCRFQCDFELRCGIHKCKKTCQPMHSHQKCMETIPYTFPACGHIFHKKCFISVNSLKCAEHVEFTFPRCGHTSKKKCHQTVDDIKCDENCTRPLEQCGHPCKKKCWEVCDAASCPLCEEEANNIREAEKKAHRKLIEKEIEKIRQQNHAKNPCITELSPNGDSEGEYREIEEVVIKYTHPGHSWLPSITRIRKVMNLKLKKKWLEAQKDMFDATRYSSKIYISAKDNVERVIRDGFKIETESSDPRATETGITFSTYYSVGEDEIECDSETLLLCDVLLGKSKTVKGDYQYMTAKKLRKEKYDSLFVNYSDSLHDKFVVFNPHQALVKYAVQFTKKMRCNNSCNNLTLEQLARTQLTTTHHHITLTRTCSGESNELADHYRIAESQFLRLTTSCQKRYVVQSVDYYLNPTLIIKFSEKWEKFTQKYGTQSEESQFVLAFHGTRCSDNVDKIIQTNFDLSKVGSNAGQLYGAGIYFSEFPEVSLNYNNGNEGRLLLCRVLPGKSYDCTHAMPKTSLQNGFDSHRFGADGEGRGKILVIFDVDQILPCYVINYTN